MGYGHDFVLFSYCSYVSLHAVVQILRFLNKLTQPRFAEVFLIIKLEILIERRISDELRIRTSTLIIECLCACH